MIRGRLAKAIDQAVKELDAAPMFMKGEAGMVALKTASEAIAQLENRVLDLEAAAGVGEGAQA